MRYSLFGFHAACLHRRLVGRGRLPGLWIKEPCPTCRGTGGTHRVHLTGSWYEPSRTGCLGQSCPKKQTSMLLGNIVGSNLFNIGLIGGLAGIMGPVRSGAPYPWIDYLSLLVATFILIYWLGGKTLKKAEGIVLLLVYLGASICTWMANS